MPADSLGKTGTRDTTVNTSIGAALHSSGVRYNAGIVGWHIPALLRSGALLDVDTACPGAAFDRTPVGYGSMPFFRPRSRLEGGRPSWGGGLPLSFSTT